MSQQMFMEIPQEFDFNIDQQLITDFELQSTQSHSSCKQILPQNRHIFISETSSLKVFSDIGNRSKNLDKFEYKVEENFQAYAIYDGHGDQTVSVFLQKRLLSQIITHQAFHINPAKAIQEAFIKIEKQILTNLDCQRNGSTALVVIVMRQKIIVANLGDSLAFGINQRGEIIALNEQHNFSNQKQIKLVSQKGGVLIKKGKTYRLNGQMSLSRSFGDRIFKNSGCLSAQPQIYWYDKQAFSRIILASDGVFNLAGNIVKDQQLLNTIEEVESKKGRLQKQIFDDNASFINIKICP